MQDDETIGKHIADSQLRGNAAGHGLSGEGRLEEQRLPSTSRRRE
jgi:hypothetical protein